MEAAVAELRRLGGGLEEGLDQLDLSQAVLEARLAGGCATAAAQLLAWAQVARRQTGVRAPLGAAAGRCAHAVAGPSTCLAACSPGARAGGGLEPAAHVHVAWRGWGGGAPR